MGFFHNKNVKGEMILTDSHAHLLDESFEKDLEEVMERARISNVEYINNCINIKDNKEMEGGIELTNKYTNVFLSAGLHPFEAESWCEEIEKKILSFTSDRLIAIGEIGIDPTYNVPIESQSEVFRNQIDIAKKRNLPIVIHCRHGFNEVYKILKEEKFFIGGILHTFSGTWENAVKFLDLGFYLSFSGVLTYSKRAKEAALKAPLDRIIIETDSPYLPPLPYKGQRNEPSYIVRTVEELSRLKGCSIEKTADITTNNFISVFLNGRRKKWN